ncbi:hypothetical protein M885DRAFT_547758 [Pelagophyceae sp. CCMP2097]|nr:hypothetical protein M885DRAFT_547758 [Pelagophyceae sp. CCMP2097]
MEAALEEPPLMAELEVDLLHESHKRRVRRRRATAGLALICFVLAVAILSGGRLQKFSIAAWLRDAHRRKLANIGGYAHDTSWRTNEALSTALGVVPSITCPVGSFRPSAASDSNFRRRVGFRTEGCRDCPRGRYGESEGLLDDGCTADCPLGRYRDTPGGTSELDCLACPPGTFGDARGLTSRQCAGNCAPGKYSNVEALEDASDCKVCPEGYRGWQCSWEIVAQHFSGDRRHIDQLDVRPRSKLRASPLSFRKGPNRPQPVDLSIPNVLPLVNLRPQANRNGRPA